MSKEIQNRVDNLIEYFKSNPRSSVYACLVIPTLEYLDEILLDGCNLEQMLKNTTKKFCIVFGNSVPNRENVRFEPYLYDTQVEALKDICLEEERVVSGLEYIEMCVEYEKNHK